MGKAQILLDLPLLFLSLRLLTFYFWKLRNHLKLNDVIGGGIFI